MTEVNKNIDNRKTKKTEILQKTWAVCALALVCTFLWGSASPCIKLGYALFEIPSGETWTQVLFAGMRFVLSTSDWRITAESRLPSSTALIHFSSFWCLP